MKKSFIACALFAFALSGCDFLVPPIPGAGGNTPPQIMGAGDITISVCNTFDPRVGVTTPDAEGDIVTLSIDNVAALQQALASDTPGTFVLTYTATETRAGVPIGSTTVQRRVTVVNADCNAANNAPFITLLGPNPVQLNVGEAYVEPGATAFDVEDGVLTDQIIRTSNVDTSSPESYVVTYEVTDSDGFTTTETRTVIVSN